MGSKLEDQFLDEFPAASEALGRLSGRQIDKLTEERQIVSDLSSRTGILSLDILLGGALPAGATCIYGGPAAGKTLMAGHILTTAQKTGYRTAMVAAEYWDGWYLKEIGVDLDALPLVPWKTKKELLEFLRDFFSEENSVAVIDSISALHIDRTDYWDWADLVEEIVSDMGSAKKGCSLVLTSQVRQLRSAYKDETYTKEIRSDLKRFDSLMSAILRLTKADRSPIGVKGYTLSIEVMKSLVGKPSCWVDVRVVKGKGIELQDDIVSVAVSYGVLENDRGKIYFDGRWIGTGTKQSIETLERNPSLRDEIIDRLVESVDNS